jgi:hypothetical protein
MAERHAKFIDDPFELIDILDFVIKKLSQQKAPAVSADKVLQFNEITKAIERLKESGAVVPDELRRLKIDLSSEVSDYERELSQHEKHVSILQEMDLRLGNSHTKLRATIVRLTGGKRVRQKTVKRYVKRTSPALFRKELRKALRELGGAGKKSEVLQRIRMNMEQKFKSQDVERDAQGNLNWERWVVAEKAKMMKEGIIKTGSEFGIWELRRKTR